MEPTDPTRNVVAQGTIGRIRQELASGKAPVVAQILELLRTITQNAANISVQQLADLISQDPEVMVRIIGVANKLAYNPGGVEIATIQQAISIIGYERIRNLSVSVMLMENAESQLSGDEKRELAGIALASGFMARELFLSLSGLDPEVAFVCAALRNYGKLLLSTFLPEDYSRARILTRTVGEGPAFHQVFGLTPLELGRELLEAEHLPPVILDTMRQVDRQALEQQVVSPLEQLIAVSEFSVRLFESLSETDLTAEKFGIRAAELAHEWVPTLKLRSKGLLDLIKQVSHRCEEIAGAAGIDSLQTPLFRRVVAFAEGRPLPPGSTLSRRLSNHSTGFALRETATRGLQLGRTELAAHADQTNPNLPNLFTLLVQILQRHLALRDVIVFLTNSDNHSAAARYGVGNLFRALAQRNVVNRSQRDVFALCLTRGEDIVLENISNPRLRAFIPPWLLNVANDHPVILLALNDDLGTFGFVLGIGNDRASFQLFEGTRPELAQIRMALAKVGPVVRAIPEPPRP